MLQEFVQAIEDAARSVMEEMHTSIPARIQKYDVANNRAIVKPYGTFVTGSGKRIDYPVITGVPIIFPQCQSAGVEISFPVKAGDDCLVIISEVELDAWLGGGESDNDMRYDLTSAIAIPGLRKNKNSSIEEACKTNSIILKNKNTKVKIKENGVEIVGNLKVSGNIISDNIIHQ